MNRKYATVLDRIIARSCKVGECLVWQGCRDSKGYGRISLRRPGFKRPAGRLVHRVMFEIWHARPIMSGMTLDHLDCVSAACWNPHHLEEVTRVENVRRAHARRG